MKRIIYSIVAFFATIAYTAKSTGHVSMEIKEEALSNSLEYANVVLLSLSDSTFVSGTVRDKADGSPVPYATVVLIGADSSVIVGAATDSNGAFLLSSIKAGAYKVRISYIGYETAYIEVKVGTESGTLDIGEIELGESASKLQEVVVTARRPFVEQLIDRYVVDVGSHLITSGRDALDVLGVTPGVVVTPEGDVTVMGKPVSVYIDGRPSNLSGKELQTLLSSTQGETIDKIEVITNPSARYEASGGSIINIRMKKSMQHGLKGSANVGYRQGRADRENAGVIFNYRYQQLNIYGNYSANRRNSRNKVIQTNTIETDGTAYTFDQSLDYTSHAPRYGHQYCAGVDYQLNDNHTVGALLSGYYNTLSDDGLKGKTLITPTLDGIDCIIFDNRLSERSDGKQANLNWQGVLSAEGRQINVDVDYGEFNNLSRQYATNEYFDASSTLDNKEQLCHSNPPEIKVWSIKADYAHPLSKTARLEFGVKSGQSQTDNNLKYETFDGIKWNDDTDRSNHFTYTEEIHAGYVNAYLTLGKLSLQAGLRGEYTRSKGDQRTTGTVSDTTYLDLFPSFNASYAYSNKHQMTLGYGRRIFRPMYEQLNPFEIKIDAYSFESGNPHLRPMTVDNLFFTYTNPAGIMSRLSYSRTNDKVEQMPVQDNDRYGMRMENFDCSQYFALMLNYRKSFAGRWTFNVSLEGQYVKNTSQERIGTFESDGLGMEVQLYSQFAVTPTLSASLTAMYVSPQKQSYLEVKSMSNVSASVSKSFMQDRLTVTLTGNDLLAGFKMDIRSRTEDVVYHALFDRDSRWASIGLRYAFDSGKVKPSRRRDSGITEEMERVKQ